VEKYIIVRPMMVSTSLKNKFILGFTANGLSYDSTGVYRASMTIGEQGVYLYYGQVSSAYQWTIGLSIGPDLNNLVGVDEANLNYTKRFLMKI